jgi:hypothetical protein
MLNLIHDPITVVVKDGRWDAYGPVTPRSQELYAILAAMGGVNESVADGTYHFNVTQVGLENIASLTPVTD